uniref:Uncharacterized protein n=1 Tax=Arundo donax TaxID=35708 RepID=A0A0A9F862_ARUDO
MNQSIVSNNNSVVVGNKGTGVELISLAHYLMLQLSGACRHIQISHPEP